MSRLSSKVTRALVPLSNLPERTVWVDNTVVGATCALTGQAIDHFDALVYRDSNGQYVLRFSGRVDFSSATLTNGILFSLPNINFLNGSRDAFNLSTETFQSVRGITNNNGANGELWASTSGPCTAIWIDGELQLASAPTWFDANKEAGFSIAAQVEDATATTSGLIPAFEEGTYTPTASSLVNCSINHMELASYIRVGNSVTVWGYVNFFNPGSGDASLQISLPFASNFTAANQAAGSGITAWSPDAYQTHFMINANTGSGNVNLFTKQAANPSAQDVTYHFSYRIY